MGSACVGGRRKQEWTEGEAQVQHSPRDSFGPPLELEQPSEMSPGGPTWPILHTPSWAAVGGVARA